MQDNTGLDIEYIESDKQTYLRLLAEDIENSQLKKFGVKLFKPEIFESFQMASSLPEESFSFLNEKEEVNLLKQILKSGFVTASLPKNKKKEPVNVGTFEVPAYIAGLKNGDSVLVLFPKLHGFGESHTVYAISPRKGVQVFRIDREGSRVTEIDPTPYKSEAINLVKEFEARAILEERQLEPFMPTGQDFHLEEEVKVEKDDAHVDELDSEDKVEEE